MSSGRYSRANACRGASSARWARRVSVSADSSTASAAGERASRPQPESDSAPPPASSFSSVSRRVSFVSRFMVLLLDAVAAGDHRHDVVDEARQHDHRQVDGDEGDQETRQQEMDGARRLTAAERIDQPGEG